MNKVVCIENGVRHVYAFQAPAALRDILPLLPIPCGGKGTCGSCRVRASGKLSPPNAVERAHLSASQLSGGLRLGCQVRLLGDATVTILSKSQTQKASSGSAPMKTPLGKQYGFAIDLGTTTLYAALYNLSTGEKLGEASAANPQVRFGSDVLTRIEQSLSGERTTLCTCIRHALFDLCAKLLLDARLAPSDADAAVLCANTAMLYLLFGLDAGSIAAAPFRCDHLFGDFYPADFLPMQRGAKVYVPRCISAFLGADAAAAALACGFNTPGNQMLCDLGTNGEILLRTGDQLLGCSCAAGPAFEGVGLSCGMPAAEGAVSTVMLSGGQTIFRTHGHTRPIGLCGSGYTDWIACLRKIGVLSPDGALNSDRVYLADTPLYLSQKDVRAFQLAKSAVRTGMEVLLSKTNGQPVSVLSLAGSFGSALNVQSAVSIGLIPTELRCRTKAVGNAAATGCAMILLNDSLTKEITALAQKIETVSLADLPDFNDKLCENLTLQ